jgi:hypothetical protein
MQKDKDLQCLDELIAKLGGCNDAGRRSRSPCDLLLEHLQAARRNLPGSMPGEYSFSLRQAKESVACILNKSARMKVKKVLRILIDSVAPKTAVVRGRWRWVRATQPGFRSPLTLRAWRMAARLPPQIPRPLLIRFR